MSGWDVAVAVAAVVGQVLTEIGRGLWAVTKWLVKVAFVVAFVLLCTGRTGRTGRQLEYRTRPD